MQKGMENSMIPGGDGDIKDDVLDFFNKVPELLGAYDEAMKEAQKQAELLGIDVFRPGGSSGAASLGSEIQNISENTANLLGSYLNAMRADVALKRGLIQTHLPQISHILAQTCPTLLDYQNKIAANTYNTAQNTAEMAQKMAEGLAELKDVRERLDSWDEITGGRHGVRIK